MVTREYPPADSASEMTLTDQQPSAPDLRQAIVDLCSANWEQTGKAYLLSRLGLDLSREGYDLKQALRGAKLLHFLTHDLSDVLRIEQNPDNPIEWGIFPKAAKLTRDVPSYFHREAKKPAADAVAEIQFHKAFWAAFVVPLQAGNARFIQLAPVIQFTDLADTAAVPPSSMQIEPEFILDDESLIGRERHDRVYKAVIDWCKKHELEPQRFAASEHTLGHRVGHPAKGTVLHLLLRLLGPRDLARISMPLDIVSRLLAEPVERD